ncbi:hypothetical protein [Sphingobacterium faecale]|uniref:Lipocalin-like domain-containing protein n=1 Tax=Sphingobacterium faecale TaxID=2803775 RepID=A0ABS1R7P3_9SPHI|nr:hypothetical protein [Sphingobacterium faecale]MBL1409871.1 hypothetical protein [Sphingobacterium faecale]
MKRCALVFTVIITVLFYSCKKSDETSTAPFELAGKWKLTEVYADPGNGAGKFRKIEGKKTLEFTKGGQVKSTNGDLCFINLYSSANESSNFEVKEMYDGLNKIVLEKCETEISFEIKADELTLYYNCIEGCGEKFKRVE